MLTPVASSVIDFVGSDGGPVEAPIATQAFAPAFAALWNCQSIKCKYSQRVFESLPRPTLAVISVRGLLERLDRAPT
jgi:hypothetical protein